MAGDLITGAHHVFTRSVAASLRRRCGVGGGARVVVATSGGADSVALLRALAAVAPRRRWRLELAVAHVQHHLRDESGDAERDAEFTAELAGKLGLAMLRRDLNLSADEGNVEANARRGRYAAMAAMAKEFDAQFVATGHHGDDQLETLLMRLLRGASVRGLAAMAWQRPIEAGSGVQLIRPMLGVDLADVRGFLTDLNQGWREDYTNAQTTQLRARLRQEVTPRLREIRPDVAKRVANVTEQLREVARMVRDEAKAAGHAMVRQVGDAVTIDRACARERPEIVLAELLRRLLAGHGVNTDTLGQRKMGPILRAIGDQRGGDRAFELGDNVTITVTRDQIRIESS